MRSHIARIFQNEFFCHNFLMFMAAMLANVMNYVYQIYMGRLLGPVEYGIFGSLFALFYLLSVFTGTIQIGCSRYISVHAGKKDNHLIRAFIRGTLKRTVIIAVLVFIVYFLTIPSLSSYLRINNFNIFLLLGISFSISIITPALVGALQGLKNFKGYAISNDISTAAKLFFGITLVLLGFGIHGAITGLILSSLVLLGISAYILRTQITGDNEAIKPQYSEIYRYSLPALVILFCIAIPTNLDVILVKHYFSDLDSGLYVATSVLGKIILFMSSMIPIVMLPNIASLGNDKITSRKFLRLSLLYSGLLSGIPTLILIFYPELVGNIFGSGFSGATEIIKLYALVMFLFSLIIVLANYCMAKNYMRYGIIFSTFSIVEIIAIIMFPHSLELIIWVMIILNGALLITSYFYVSYSDKRNFL